MNKAHLIFRKNRNSFSVHVKNLEQLTVQEIQIIETFVSVRNGIFDFNTYIFFIPKNLDFDDFVSLMEHININAICEEEILEIKNSNKINFGQYKGMYYSELPDSYLTWLKTNYRGKDREFLDTELSNKNL